MSRQSSPRRHRALLPAKRTSARPGDGGPGERLEAPGPRDTNDANGYRMILVTIR
jgi:hypothetical protein